MPVVVQGEIPEIVRAKTGLYLLDKALSSQGVDGMPLRSLYEIYGKWHVGKSTLAYYLSGRVKPNGTIIVADIEGTADPAYLRSVVEKSNFDGTVRLVNYQEKKGELRSHEAMVQEVADGLFTENASAGVIDSIGMLMPVIEKEGDIEEAFVGRRAQVAAKLSRRASFWLRVAQEPKALFCVNHTQVVIGGRGTTTPGGDALKYAASVRLKMYRAEGGTMNDGSFLAKIVVEKLRYGGASKERVGQVFIIPGIGVSPELTAMFDLEEMGLVKREQTVKLKISNKKTKVEEWKPMGRLSTLMEAARMGDNGKLKPFVDAIRWLDGGDDEA